MQNLKGLVAVFVGLCSGFAYLGACTSPKDENLFSANEGGMAGEVGQSSNGASGSGGSSSSEGGPGGGAGKSAQGGSAGTVAAGGTGGVAGMSASGGVGGTAVIGGAAGAGGDDIIKIARTSGCGKDPGQELGMAVRGTIQTSGNKPANAADSKKGPWSYVREYYVTLPKSYDKNRAYPLIFQGPGCGGKGTDVYPLNNSVDDSAIRVGLTPPPNDIGHATNPGQGCFDDKEGDDSVDWVFYENLHDKLSGQLCFDKNRVFASGNSSGGWFANEVGCKYAGDATRPIRGIMPNTGGLPTDAKYVPTCTNKPMSGMWCQELGDPVNPFTGTKVAIARAMKVNGCTIGSNFDNAMFEDFPIGGGNPANTCKKIKGCPLLYPLVVCGLAGNGHGSHDNVANPGFAAFVKIFSAAPLLAP